MNIVEILKTKVESPGTKNHELKYNDIYLVDNEGILEVHILMNNKKISAIIPYSKNEKLINELKSVTWTVEPNGTTIKSSSYVSEVNKDIRLCKLLKKYNLTYKIKRGINYKK